MISAKGRVTQAKAQTAAQRVAAGLHRQMPQLMLDSFMDTAPNGTEQGRSYSKALMRLRRVLGSLAEREDIAEALRAVDSGVGEYLVETTNEVWHVAWATAAGSCREGD